MYYGKRSYYIVVIGKAELENSNKRNWRTAANNKKQTGRNDEKQLYSLHPFD